jgi:hypothetical protein
MQSQLRSLILRKFKSEGDVELAQQLVFDSRGIQRARDLAAEHAALAAQAVSHIHLTLSLHPATCTGWRNSTCLRTEPPKVFVESALLSAEVSLDSGLRIIKSSLSGQHASLMCPSALTSCVLHYRCRACPQL